MQTPWPFSGSSPERTAFTLVPATNDLGQYSASHPSQMAKVTGRPPARFPTPNLFDSSGRVPFLPPPGSPAKQNSAQVVFNSEQLDFDDSTGSQHNYSHVVPLGYPNQDLLSDWSAIPVNETLTSDSIFASRPLNDFHGLPFSDLQYAHGSAATPTYLQDPSPSLMPNTLGSNGINHARVLRNETELYNHPPNSSRLNQGSRGGHHFSGSNCQYNSEAESDMWTPSTLYSERTVDTNSSSCGTHDPHSAGAALANQTAVNGEHDSFHTLKSNPIPQFTGAPDLLPAINDLDFHGPFFPGRSDGSPHDASSGLSVSHKAPFSSHEDSADLPTGSSRGYRLLQPQPQRMTDRLPPFASTMDNDAKCPKKTSST